MANFRSYVIAATSSDGFDDSVSHVAVELRPSAILRLALTALVAWFVHKVIGWLHFYHLEVSFSETTWLDWRPPTDNPEAEYPDDWEEGAVVYEIDPAWPNEAGLIGYSAQVAGDGGLWFVCSHKHSGTEFMSNEVYLRSLVRAIRLIDVLAELGEWSDRLYKRFNPDAAGQPA